MIRPGAHCDVIVMGGGASQNLRILKSNTFREITNYATIAQHFLVHGGIFVPVVSQSSDHQHNYILGEFAHILKWEKQVWFTRTKKTVNK